MLPDLWYFWFKREKKLDHEELKARFQQHAQYAIEVCGLSSVRSIIAVVQGPNEGSILDPRWLWRLQVTLTDGSMHTTRLIASERSCFVADKQGRVFVSPYLWHQCIDAMAWLLPRHDDIDDDDIERRLPFEPMPGWDTPLGAWSKTLS